MGATNLALRFTVEVIAVGAVGYWGFNNSGLRFGRIALGIGTSLALVVVLALLVAPHEANPLSQAQRDVIGTALLVLAAGRRGRDRPSNGSSGVRRGGDRQLDRLGRAGARCDRHRRIRDRVKESVRKRLLRVSSS